MNELTTQDTSSRTATSGDVASPAKPSVGGAERGRSEATETGKTLPAAAATNARPASPPSASSQVDEAVVKLNDYVQSLQRELKFTVDAELGRSVVSVVDSNTQQVIRKIPNDVAIRLARNLKDLQGIRDEKQSQALADSQTGSAGYGGAASVDLSLIDIKA